MCERSTQNVLVYFSGYLNIMFIECLFVLISNLRLLIVFTNHLFTYLTLGEPHDHIKIELSGYGVKLNQESNAGG